MTLLAQYLKTVGMYLPGKERADIIRELGENLQAEMDEREAELGRPLTEPEQQEFLLGHGNPMIVAGRYGGEHRAVSFGRQLIGPELFPLYIRVLLGNWIISAIVHAGIAFSSADANEPRPFFLAVTAQLVIITAIFSAIDLLQRRSRSLELEAMPRTWRFPPPYLQTIPRWQSRSGFIVWVLASAWWAAIPYAPALLIGGARTYVKFAPVWSTYYWPVLFLMLAGVAQRAANYVRPDWNWLPPVMRLGISLISLALLYPMAMSGPYFIPIPAAGVAAERVAEGLNVATRVTIVWGLSITFLIWAAMYAAQCVQHARFLRRQRLEASR